MRNRKNSTAELCGTTNVEKLRNSKNVCKMWAKYAKNVCSLSLSNSLSLSLPFSMDRYNHLSKHQTQPAIHTFVCPRLCLCASFCGNLLWLPFVVCGPRCLCVCIGKPLKVRDTHTSFGITNMHLICSHQKPFPSITHTPRGTRRKSEHV